MGRKKILILVDNPLRDFPACLLLGSYLSADADIFFSPTAQAPQEIFRFQPDLVLLNYLRDTNLALVRKLILAEIPFSILDTEGGIFMKIPGTNETSYTMTLIKDKTIRNKARHVFCWGPNLAKALTDKKAYPPENIFCLGTPRMDFYHSSFKNFYGSLDELKTQLIGKSKPVILINTSFAGNNPKFSNRADELEMLIQKFGYDRKFMSDFLDQMDIVMNAYISMTSDLAMAYPHVQFVLRPHPFESFKVYEDALKKFDNVMVDCTGTVAPWLFISDALIHYECSTAIEAAFAGKPSLSLGQFKDLRPVDAIQSLTEYTDSIDEMKIKIGQIIEKKYLNPSDKISGLRKVEEEVFFKVDGQSYLRIGNEIRSWIKNLQDTTSFKAMFHRFLFSTYLNFRTLIKISIKGQALPTSKKLSPSEAQNILDNLNLVTGIKAKLSQPSFSTSLKLSSASAGADH
jgi:surface carbohydrate biosynthesis protein